MYTIVWKCFVLRFNSGTLFVIEEIEISVPDTGKIGPESRGRGAFCTVSRRLFIIWN